MDITYNYLYCNINIYNNPKKNKDNKMISVQNPKDCCGCSACASICNHNAITMKPDVLGFLYPEVDLTKCTNCSLCERVCAFNDNYDTSLNLQTPIAYGARHRDINEVMKSRSGAVFATLSDYVLEKEGVVYGAGYTDHFRVVHKRATTKEERDEFRGSKYVQSDMNNVFRLIKKDLKEGLIVLFSGTPCQTSGLNSYIGKKLRSNLILIDIVCHGVPGPYLWRDYISYLERKQGSSITWVNFRDKEMFGWAAHHETFKFNNSDEKKWFKKVFYQHIMFRHSCENCHFCNTKRPSDITIADFWGWQNTKSDINCDDKGLNLVLINTEKGKNIFGKISGKLRIIEASPNTYMQPNLQYPFKVHRKRMQFEKDYVKYGFEYVFNKTYNEYSIWKKLIDLFRKKIRNILNR